MRNQTQFIVELSKLAGNYSKLKKLTPKNETIFMVKANAYGHGLVEIVDFAYKNLGIREFGVASIGEAITLRKALIKEPFEIYVFSDLELGIKKCEEAYTDFRIIPVIANFLDLELVLNNKNFKFMPLFLKLNTGMNRLGFAQKDWQKLIQKLQEKNIKEIYHLCTHFSSSFYPVSENKKIEEQLAAFNNAKKLFRDNQINIKYSSVANSGAIEQGIGLAETHVRPGIMLYGPSCLERTKSSWSGESISRLSTYILDKFEIKKGESFGYADTKIDQDGVMLILPVGYGDGVTRNYRGVKISYKNQIGEVVGRINMDMIYLFFKEAKLESFKIGDAILVWGHDQKDVISIADIAGTITYEIFCQISLRVPKIYKI
ncbi:MAG: alanine racemase [Bacteriovoracaceae bacterium]